jgi:hypothetical protein
MVTVLVFYMYFFSNKLFSYTPAVGHMINHTVANV